MEVETRSAVEGWITSKTTQSNRLAALACRGKVAGLAASVNDSTTPSFNCVAFADLDVPY